MTRQSTPTHSPEDDVTLVTGTGRKPIWNYTEASEPLSSRPRQTPDMLSPATIQKYVILILIAAVGITLLILLDRPPSPTLVEIMLAIFFGWLLGQLWRWEPPR
jgi:hypothetical protein